MQNHTIIIGGGIIGLLSGRELLARGHAVTIIDAGAPERSASTGNAGVIAPGHPPVSTPEAGRQGLRLMFDRRGPLYISPRPRLGLLSWLREFRQACRPHRFETVSGVLDRFSRHSRTCFEPLLEECPDSLRPSGFIEVARTAAGQAHLQREFERLDRAGFQVELVEGDELRRQDPGWDTSVRLGIRQHEGIVARPGDLFNHLGTAFRAAGGTLRRHARVQTIHRNGDQFTAVQLADGERISGSSLLIASGIWSQRLVAQLGLRIPMEPAKGYHVMVTMEPPPAIACVLNEACVVVNPMGPTVRLAGTLEFSGINHRMVARRVDQLARTAQQYLPAVGRATRQSAWNGLRPCTGDGLPAIGPVPGTPNAFLATGHAMMGVTLGPGTADLVADAIEQRPWPHWAHPLSAKRFRRPPTEKTTSAPVALGR